MNEDILVNTKRQLSGRRSRIAGNTFENIIDTACCYYREKGMAIVEKTPEPMKPLYPYGDRRKGQYIACFDKKAQPDYKGVLCDGTAIIFEAKHTDSDRIRENVVTETQRQTFDDFYSMGAQCFVLVSMGFRSFYRVPWMVFKDMKSQFGRKYMKLEELNPYKLTEKQGILLMLEGVKLNEN